MAAESVELARAFVSVIPSMKGARTQIAKDLGAAAPAVEKTGRSLGGTLTKGLKWAAVGAGGAIAGVIGKSLVGGFKRLTSIENAQAKLTGLGHSAGNVQKIMDNALAAVKGTAYGLDEAAGVAASTVAAGIKPGKELEGVLKLVGDASTIAGVGMGEMGAIFNKVAASNKIQGDVINQLHDAGIPIVAMLGEELNKTAAEVYDMASAGEIGFDTFRSAMEKGLGGAALKSGNTTVGSFKNMNAALSRFGVTLLKDVHPLLAPFFNTITGGLDKATEKVGPFVSLIGERVGGAFSMAKDGAQGLYDLIVNGDFTGAFGKAFGVYEDAPIVDFLLTLREKFIETRDEIVGGARAFGQAFLDGGTDITSSGFAGILESIGLTARNLWDAAGPALGQLIPAAIDVVTALSPLGLILEALAPVLPQLAEAAGKLAGVLAVALAGAFEFLAPIVAGILTGLADFVGWITESEDRMKIAAGVITAVAIPALLTWGTQAAIAGVKNVIAWATSAAGAVKAGIVYSLQGIKIIGTWVAMGIAAMKSGAQTVAIWAMYKAEAIKGAAVHAVQSARVATAWAVQSTAAFLSGAKQKAVWVGTIVAQAASSAGTFALHAAKVVGGWVLMGAQSLIHAARMAAAWFIALGPVGWVIAAVVGLVALVIANWDKVVGWTRKAWDWVVGALRNAGQWLKDTFAPIFTWFRDKIIGPVFTWINDKVQWWWRLAKLVWGTAIDFIRGAFATAFTWFRDRVIKPVWDTIGGLIDTAWNKVIKPVFETLRRAVSEDVPRAFENAKKTIGEIWAGIQEVVKAPIRFVIERVINDGLIGAFNTLAGLIGMGKLDPVPVPGWLQAKGKQVGSGSKGPMRAFARGGVLPGYEPRKRDTVLTPMRAGEGVLVPEVMRATGAGWLHALNRAGNTGGVSAVRRLLHEGRAKGGLIHPMGGPYTVSSGYRTGSRPDHDGIDFAAATGTPVKAAAKGSVLLAGWGAGGAGNMVKLHHGGGLESLYYHLASVAVRAGQAVKAGQLIGGVGSTGNSTGPHLHFTVRQGGRDVNPASFLAGDLGEGTGGSGVFNPFAGMIDLAANLLKGAFPGGAHFIDLVAGVGKEFTGRLSDWVGKKIAEVGDFVSDTAGTVGTVVRWTGTASKALRHTGDWSVGNLASLMRRMQQESGGNPNAVNDWDVNAQRGTPSKGLMQVIGPTFAAYRDPSLPNNVLDPLANIVAAIRYTKARYGSLRAGWDRPGGYALGGIIPTLYDDGGWLEAYGRPQLVQNKTGKPEAVLTDERWRIAEAALDRVSGGGDQYHFHGVPMDQAEDFARAVMFERRRIQRGGKYAGAQL